MRLNLISAIQALLKGRAFIQVYRLVQLSVNIEAFHSPNQLINILKILGCLLKLLVCLLFSFIV